MSQYRVHPFHVHSGGSWPILITARSMIKLGDEAFCRMLQRLFDDQSSIVTEASLAQRAAEQNLPHEATRDYLLAKGVLQRLGSAAERISRVQIVSTDEQWRTLLCDNVLGVPVAASDDLSPHTLDEEIPTGFPLCVLLLPSYSRAKIESFYQCLTRVKGASGLIAYFRYRTLCVSSVYSPAYRTPCHFCQVGWESRSQQTPNDGASSIFALMRTFEGLGEQEIPAAPLLALDRSTACAFLSSHIQQLAGVDSSRLLQEEITTGLEFDLQSFTRTKHAAVHWPGCDCQYREVDQP